MELLISLLKQLATTLSPTEFLFTLMFLTATIFTIVKLVLKNVKNPKKLIGAFSEDENDELMSKSEIGELYSEIRKANSTDNFNLAMTRLFNMIEAIKKENKDQDAEIAKQIHSLAFIKQDIENFSDSIEKELNDIKHSAKMHEVHQHQSGESIKELLLRGHDIMSRTQIQLEKLDEYVKNSTSEMKTNNREISKEMAEIRKELALLERTVQTHINIDRAGGVTLR